MRSYYAVQGNIVRNGAWIEMIKWARKAVVLNELPVQLLTARAGEKSARIIAEIDVGGERLITQGRIMSVKNLRG